MTDTLMKNIEQTEKLLKDYVYIKASIENMEKEIKELELDIGISGIDYSKDRTCETYKITSPTEGQALIAEKIRNIKKKIKINESKTKRIEKAISCLSEQEATVIEYFYFKGLPYYGFCYKIHVSPGTAKRRRKNAVRKIAIALFGE